MMRVKDMKFLTSPVTGKMMVEITTVRWGVNGQPEFVTTEHTPDPEPIVSYLQSLAQRLRGYAIEPCSPSDGQPLPPGYGCFSKH